MQKIQSKIKDESRLRSSSWGESCPHPMVGEPGRSSAGAERTILRDHNVALMRASAARALPAAVCGGPAKMRARIQAGRVDVVVLCEVAHGDVVYKLDRRGGVSSATTGIPCPGKTHTRMKRRENRASETEQAEARKV